ncbi:MAG: ribosome maturation factor RimM [Bacillota bacterium]|jgi:16S rRNA processing protein RimM
MIEMTEKYNITVGKIVAVFGVKGQLKVECLSDFPERFSPGNSFFVEKTAQVLTLESTHWHGKRLLLKFLSIDDRTAAETLCPSLLKIQEDQLMPLPKGHYYHFQIVGLTVYEGENKLGVVTEVRDHLAHDIYIIKKESGKELLLPALKSIVKDISLADGVMKVKLPSGLDD